MYALSGTAQDALVAAGPTGYFGGIAVAALREYQDRNDLAETWVYNNRVRDEFIALAR